MNRTHIGLGIFVLGTLGLLIWLAQSIGAIGGSEGARYEVRLVHAAGLVENNAVKIAGVQVGRIEKIAVDHDIAVLTLRVDEEIVLHDDARAIVRAKSLLGEKYLQLEPGTREAPVLEAGSEITDVHAPFEIDEVLNALEPILGGEQSLATVIGPLVATLDELLRDAAGKDGKPPLITRDRLEKMVSDLEATSASVRRMTEGNEQQVASIVDNADKLLADPRLPRIIGNVDGVMTTLDDRLPALLDRTEKTLDKLDKLASVVDDDRAAKLRVMIDDASVATKNLRKLSGDLDGLTKDLEPLVAALSVIAKRASSIDENVIRKFLQREGVKIFVGGKREAQDAIEDVP